MGSMASQITSLLNRLSRCRSKKTTGLCEGNSPVTGLFPALRASNAENDSIWWRHHESNEHIQYIFSNTFLTPHRLWAHFATHTLLKMCSIIWGYTKCFAQSVVERQPFGLSVEKSSGSMKRECLFDDICLNLMYTPSVVICKTCGTTINTNFVKMVTFSFYRCKLTYRCPSKGLE